MATIGPYIIEAELGRGGMGAVFRARHAELDRACALKVIPVVGDTGTLLAQRFEREALLMTRVVHPGVVRIYDFGQVDRLHYIAMELLEGTNLEDWLKARPDVPLDALDVLALGIARGVGALHEVGIVHRDLKPGNVMVTPGGEPKVMDLGLARTEDLSVLTRAGAISGTPAYMPPEAGQSADPLPSYDVYAVGLILHRLYTGKGAFEKSPLAYVMRDQPLPEPRILAMQHGLGRREHVIRRCLERDPDRRPRDGNALAAELAEVLPPGISRAVPALPREEVPEEDDEGKTLVLPQKDRATRVARPAPGEGGRARGGRSGRPPVTHVTRRRMAVAAILLAVAGVYLVVGGRRGERVAPEPAASIAPPPESFGEWVRIKGSMRLEDTLSVPAGPATAKTLWTDPLLLPFAAEIRESLLSWEQNRMVEAYYSEIEYWPDPLLDPAAAAASSLVPLDGERPTVTLAAPPPGPVRRIVLRLRPGERYQLRMPGKTVDLTAPSYSFARDVWIAEGFDDIIVIHPSLGRECRLVVARSSDGSLPPEREEPETGPSGVQRIHHGGLVGDDELTILIFDGKGPSSRQVLARISWRKGRREKMLQAHRGWMTSVTSILRRKPDMAAEMRTLANFTSDEDLARKEGPIDHVAMVMDFRHAAHPDALRAFETFSAGDEPQIQRGALYALAFQYPRRHVARFAHGMTSGDAESWILCAEALSIAGDPRGPAAMKRRLVEGKVSTQVHWSWAFSRTIPTHLHDILRERGRDPTRISPSALPLLDQLAGYMGGPEAGEYLASLPDERLIGARHFSLILMLRLIGTKPALRRLEELAATRRDPSGAQRPRQP